MTPAEVKAIYRRMMDDYGETVQIRRYTGTGSNRPWFDTDAMARVTRYEPEELVGTIVQGDRRLIVLAEDLIAGQFALPVRKGDKVVVRGAELSIEAADDNTRRVAGELIAVELQVRG
jgi:hypothetical protein